MPRLAGRVLRAASALQFDNATAPLSCKLVESCVLGSRQSVVFSGYGPAGRLIDVVSHPERMEKTSLERANPTNTERKQCVVAAEALAELGYRGRKIDLLSIDVGGAEASVMRMLALS